ncbi:MAG: glycyl-radical enzyme activating protein [Oscillospiraceae bacterium]|jgi:pyruvate formate lyase activating enzyme|nr:glycyl-radical enzyme activating protein [Oscillospiraceae bacterium]
MTDGIVFNIQRYSIDDGPGIRTTVFLKGCPLRCPWCSNPESQSVAPQLFHRHTSCVKCGACAAGCPAGALRLTEDAIVIDREKCEAHGACEECKICVDACVNGALEIKGGKMTVQQVWKVIRRDAVYYETSGGGVTCSGGEILSQPDFTSAIFKKCREEGIHTCADTSGFGTRAALDKILDYTDLVYFDLKHPDPRLHLEHIGVDSGVILDNLRRVSERGVATTLRLPLIPEYNNSPEAIEALAHIAKQYAPDAAVSILPYHRYGENKYQALGMRYPLAELRENTASELDAAKVIFEKHGFKCEVSK